MTISDLNALRTGNSSIGRVRHGVPLSRTARLQDLATDATALDRVDVGSLR